MTERTFTLEEAQTLVPVLESLLRSAMEGKKLIQEVEAELQETNSRIFLSGGSNVVADCVERIAPERSMLGVQQEAWLKDGLAHTRSRWNIIAQQTLMAQRDVKQGSEQAFWTDGWDGYPAARTRLLTDIADIKPPNPLVISGDVHSAWVSDLKPEFDNAKSAVVAIEFCGTSITSQGPSAKLRAVALVNEQILGFLGQNKG